MPSIDWSRWQLLPDGTRVRRQGERAAPALDDPAPVESGPNFDDINATPAAVTRAVELGVDLTAVTGTGAGGKITKADVEKAVK